MSTACPRRSLRTILASLIVVAVGFPPPAAAHVAETVRDEFDAVAFDNDDGTQSWTSDWQENPFSDGPLSGILQVANDAGCSGNCLRIGGTGSLPGGPWISRTADLSAAVDATLTYDVRRERIDPWTGGAVEVFVRSGSGPWTRLATYGFDTTDGSMTQASHDLVSWIGPATQIAFQAVGDQTGYVFFDDIEIMYHPANLPPTIAPAPTDRTDPEEVSLTYPILASDPDGDDGALGYAATGLPDGLSMHPGTGVISGTPNHGSYLNSPHAVTVTVTDDDGAATTATFTWTITGTNRVPTLAPIGDTTIDEGATLDVTAVAHDDDVPHDTLAYRLDDAPPGASIDRTTGRITWPTDEADGPGSYDFTVAVSDDAAPPGTASADFTVTVVEVNQAPELTDVPDQTHGIGDRVTLAMVATDADQPSNTLRFSASGLPSGLRIDAATGIISGTALTAGTWTAVVTVRDDGSPNRTDTITFSWHVVAGNHAPVLAPIAEQTPDSSGMVWFVASAADPDGDGLTFWMDDGDGAIPSGATLGPDNGEFRWSAAPSDAGRTFTFVLGVTDNGVPALSDQQTVTIRVPRPNRAPVMAPISNRSSAEGDVIDIGVAATDPDGDELTWIAVGLPGGLELTTDGRIRGELGFDLAERSPYTVTVTAADDGVPMLSDSSTFTWTISDVNRPPIVVGQAITVVGSAPSVFEVFADDPDGDALVLRIAEPPLGTVEQDGITFTYTAPNGFVGTDTFVLVADDGTAVALATFTVTVRATNRSPAATNDAYDATAGIRLTIDAPGVLANDRDADDDTLTVTLLQGTEHGTIQLQPGGAFAYEAAVSFVGVDEFTYTVSDATGASSTGRVRIRVGPAPLLLPDEAATVTRARNAAVVAARLPDSSSQGPSPGAEQPDESVTRAVLAVARASFAAVPEMRFPLGLLLLALVLGTTVGRIGLIPAGAKRRFGTGLVSSYDAQAGYGLIVPKGGGADVFVHASAIDGSDHLTPGDHVEYESVTSNRRPTAVRVWITDAR